MSVKAKQRFSEYIVALVPGEQRPAHPSRNRADRFIGVWFVVVNDRIFVCGSSLAAILPRSQSAPIAPLSRNGDVGHVVNATG
jgi:hypothetical protein